MRFFAAHFPTVPGQRLVVTQRDDGWHARVANTTLQAKGATREMALHRLGKKLKKKLLKAHKAGKLEDAVKGLVG